MSYILDALRKSDQQRKRGAAPRLQNVQVTAVVRKQPPFLLYGLSAAILLGAGIGIGWWRPWQPERPVPVSETAKPLEPGPPPQAAAPAPPPLEMASKPLRETPVQESKPAPAPAAGARERSARALAKLDAKSRTREVVPAASKPQVIPEKPVGPGPAQEQSLIAMTDLPPAIQQELPKMSIAVHAYASIPKDRLVSINNRMLREGDHLQPGLALEQITPDGMIFSYKGYRFIRGVR